MLTLDSLLFLAALSSVVGSLEGARKGFSSGFLASVGFIVVGSESLVVVCTSFTVSGEREVWNEKDDLMEVWTFLFCVVVVCDGDEKNGEEVEEDAGEGRVAGWVEAGMAVAGLKVVMGGGLCRVMVLLSSLILTPSTSACMMWMPCSASRLFRSSRLAAML